MTRFCTAAAILRALMAARIDAESPKPASHAPAKPAAKASGDILPFHATEKTLPNGLKVIVVPTGFPNIVSLQIPVKTGSRNEVEPGKSGFAHFFEHMMFRGTKAYPPEKYQAILTQAGARHNTYTTDEYNKNSADPVRKLLEVQRDHAYTTHTYKHTTMGFLKDIEDMPNQYAYSLTFFDRWYRPENCVVVVVGDLNRENVVSLAKKYYGNWKRGSYKLEIP